MFDLELDWDRPARSGSAPSRHILRARLSPRSSSTFGISAPLRIAVALDASSSMEGDKLAKAKAACRVLLSQLRPADRLSLASFASEITPWLEATPGGPSVEAVAEAAFANLQAFGVTRTDLALAWIARAFPDEPGVLRMGLLITDGHPTDPMGRALDSTEDLIRQARYAAADGQTLCTVGLGDAAHFHTAFLVELSDQGRGAFLYADTPEALEPQLQERLSVYQAIAEEDVFLEIEALLPDVKVLACCRLRPEFLPLETPIGDGKLSVRLGPISAETPTDVLLSVEIPPPGFGERVGARDVLAVRLAETESRGAVEAIAAIASTTSYTEAQRIDAGVDNDRLQWDINVYSKALQQTRDPHRTADLLSNIAFTARKAGQETLALQADRQLEDLKRTGRLNPHRATGLLTTSRLTGGRS